eukprot:716731-Rhodomonas_salina.1
MWQIRPILKDRSPAARAKSQLRLATDSPWHADRVGSVAGRCEAYERPGGVRLLSHGLGVGGAR